MEYHTVKTFPAWIVIYKCWVKKAQLINSFFFALQAVQQRKQHSTCNTFLIFGYIVYRVATIIYVTILRKNFPIGYCKTRLLEVYKDCRKGLLVSKGFSHWSVWKLLFAWGCLFSRPRYSRKWISWSDIQSIIFMFVFFHTLDIKSNARK